MVLTALRGALGFLSRLPVGRDRRAWEAFRTTPVAFVLAAYPLGALVALPVALAAALPAPAPVVAFVLLVALVLVTGVNHADGVADLGDAASVHGSPADRRAVLKDTTVGVGAVLALALVVAGLALAGLALAGLPPLALFGLVVAGEVGAKLALACVACLGEAPHDGLGAAVTSRADASQLPGPTLAALPALALTGPSPAALGALAGGLAGGLAVLWWARRALGGVNGDVFGAANEVGRVCALHLGVVLWTLW
ncbi:adenosylcobinamide-GDP ribazoletransferase [Halomarina ordinaria]|uniref:Adenosylcobinamide-GDP ribazoletransferase n=1 Tax=Halomarina ordinaria TaxID=3033939 RepID=A0ABD5U9E1_9EURY|nr:adenosylcobinamide-GDP ribazoletransferase [Halomarina sp. PSRA2]